MDVSELPTGQCCRQTPYPNPIGISNPEGQCVWNDKVYSFSNAPAKLGVTDRNGNSELLEVPEAAYLYSVCDAGDTLALLLGACPPFLQKQARSSQRRILQKANMQSITTTKPER